MERLIAINIENIPYISIEASELEGFPGSYKAIIQDNTLFITLEDYLYIFIGRTVEITVKEDSLNMVIFEESLALHQITMLSEFMYEIGYSQMKIYGENNHIIMHFDKILK